MSKIAGRSKSNAQSGSPAIQAKLTVSRPGDAQEKEADRVADSVMRMPDSRVQETPAISSAIPGLQRMCTTCDEEPEKKSGARVQRKEHTADALPLTQDTVANIQALRGGGQPLAPSTRAFFEPRFGADFSQVRVHTDARAADTATSINAKAFTLGRDIAFGPGQFAPESREGQRLLAHELTHVVQQDGQTVQHVQRDDDDKPPPQTATPAPPPDPEAVLIDDLAFHLSLKSNVVDALELSARTVTQLKTMIEKIKIDDEDLKKRLTVLDKKKRAKIAAAAVAKIQSQLAERRAQKLDELAGEIVNRTKDHLVALAEVAREAELKEEEELKANPKRKGKRRPQFGVILKYILKDTIERQIDSPRVKPYSLRADYAKPLELTKDEVLFLELYEENFVDELKALPKSMRQRLKDEVSKRTIEALPDYIQERMGTIPKEILEEWEKEFKKLDKRVRGNIEGELKGYFSVRMELLERFGSPTDVPTTIKAINDYFTKELVECEFLQASGVKGSGNTLVHANLNDALKKAEDFMKDPKRQWLDAVVADVKPLGYWATNIRENRNNPARPSEHTYGFAIDVNAHLNRNLAGFTPADWDFISAMVGERVIYEEGSTKEKPVYTEAAKELRDPSKSTEDKMLAAMKKIRSQSKTLVDTFASDSALRARLHEIVSASPAGKGKNPDQIDALVDVARQATTGRSRDRQKASQSLQTKLEENIFKQEPIASEPDGATSKLRDKLVKLLAPNLRQLGKVTDAEAAIRGQIVTPSDKATADAKQHKVGGLFTKGIVKELNAVAASDRPELARLVLRDLRLPLVHKDTDTKARALAGLLKRGFEVLDQTTDKKGAKVGPGEGMPNIAVHGFSNLNEKLVVALVHPDGGNLRWLGVHNQDMHHFELRTQPKIPKATITPPAPKPSPSSSPPGAAPPPPELIDPWAEP